MHKVPVGFIAWWYGEVMDVPSGWRLCDGNNGTPDLTDKFVVGASGTYIVGASGGTVEHVHSFTTDFHKHDILDGTAIASGSGKFATTDMNTGTGLTNSESNLPSYYALAYVMYVGLED